MEILEQEAQDVALKMASKNPDMTFEECLNICLQMAPCGFGPVVFSQSNGR